MAISKRGFPIAGVRVSIDPSWLIIASLMVISISTMLRVRHPAAPPARIWSVTTAASALFFLSILSHELAHAIVAKARGVGVDGITLFIFGGVTRMKGEPKSAFDELLIAAVGPLSSALLGFSFIAAAVPFPNDSLAGRALLWLGQANVALAIFNLLPGFPLDGGRVARAFLWSITGDLPKATQMATAVGVIVAIGLILAGGIIIAQGAILDGIWLLFIGWFMLSAGRNSRRDTEMRERLGRLRVQDAMHDDVDSIEAAETVATFVDDHVLRSGRRALVVVESGLPVGLVTLSDVQRVPRGQWPATAVRHAMTHIADVVTVGPAESLLAALEKMDDANVNQLPIIGAGKLLGVLTREAVIHMLAVHLEVGAAESPPPSREIPQPRQPSGSAR